MRRELEFRLIESDFRRSSRLEIFAEVRPGVFSVATPVIFTEVDDETEPIESCLHMQPADVNRLMDELWKRGYRPSTKLQGAEDKAGYLAHIADLRHVSFELLKKVVGKDPA